MTDDHHTGHWTGVVGTALLVAGVGVLLRQAAIVLLAALLGGFAGYARVLGPTALPTVADGAAGPVSLSRDVTPDAPTPGDAVTVRVTVHNESDRFLPDVRVVDGVPDSLAVTDGSPRHGTALPAGATRTFSYTVTATRGVHDWTPAQVVLGDPSGAVERETTAAAATTVTARPEGGGEASLPMRPTTTPFVGRVETADGGAGVAFHSTREYRPGDPLRRVDWRRFARRGDLGTLVFQVEQAASAHLLVDTRQAAYLAPDDASPHAVDRSVAAAGDLFEALAGAENRVGLSSLGRPSQDCWLSAGTGVDHRARARRLLAEHAAFSTARPERPVYARFRADRREELLHGRIDRLHRRLPADAQVVFFTPCCDDYPVTLAVGLQAAGHPVTVVSPDPTAAGTPGREVARMARDERLRRLRRQDVRVLDWPADEDFRTATARAAARWSG